MSDREQIGPVRYVLWLGVLALGGWLFLEGLEARAEHQETRAIIDGTGQQIQDTKREIRRGQTTLDALKRDDPNAIRRALQEERFVKSGNVLVEPPPGPDPKKNK